MTELRDLVFAARSQGMMTDEEATAFLAIGNPKILQTAIDMYSYSPGVMHRIASTALDEYRKKSQSTKDETPAPRAGGVTTEMAEKIPTGAEIEMPLTLEELEAMLPKAVKEATTFEPAPKWNPTGKALEEGELQGPTDKALLVRVKRIHKGVYDTPLVIASEYAPYDPATRTMGKLIKGDLILPGYAVRRAMDKNIKLVESLVYLFMLAGAKATRFSNDFMQVAVLGPFADFPQPKK